MGLKVIAVTGTPGTGKTALSKQLSLLLHYRYVDVHKLILSLRREGMVEGYDTTRRTLVVDSKKLNRALLSLIQSERQAKGLVIDSHLSHFLPVRYVNLCIVTTCSLKALKKRLEVRRYSAGKVRENLDAEIFETCLVEARESGHKVLVVDTTRRSPESAARSVARAAGWYRHSFSPALK